MSDVIVCEQGSTPTFRHKIELAWIIIIYFFAFNLHTRFTAPAYTQTFAKNSKYINTALTIHIIAGAAEVLLFHVLQYYVGTVMPDAIAFALCLVQSATNLILAKFLRRGIPAITRPSYQAGAILRPILSAAAIIFQDPNMHRSSVKIINAFIYTRAIIWLLQYWSPRGLKPSHTVQYGIAVPVAAMVSMINILEKGMDDWFGLYRIVVYQLLVAMLYIASRYITFQLENPNSENQSPSLQKLYIFLAWTGLSSLEYIKAKENDDRPSTDLYEVAKMVKEDKVKDVPHVADAEDTKVAEIVETVDLNHAQQRDHSNNYDPQRFRQKKQDRLELQQDLLISMPRSKIRIPNIFRRLPDNNNK